MCSGSLSPLISCGAAWGRAQFSPHCWSKGHCQPLATHHQGARAAAPSSSRSHSPPCQALGWHSSDSPGAQCVLWPVPGLGSHQYPMTRHQGCRLRPPPSWAGPSAWAQGELSAQRDTAQGCGHRAASLCSPNPSCAWRCQHNLASASPFPKSPGFPPKQRAGTSLDSLVGVLL